MCGVPPLNVVLCLSLSTLILGLSANINLTQLVSSSVALPAQLVPIKNEEETETMMANWLKICLFSIS